LQFRAKQRLKLIYGMFETQFRRAFELAERRGVPTQHLLINLERRLDNVIYRLGFSASRRQARQLVNHGHIRVDGHRVDIPSYLVRPGSILELSPKAKRFSSVQLALEAKDPESVVGWLKLDRELGRGEVLRYPTPEELSDVPADPRLVVEFYSK
jgi:small subunit ribosomal protein S4